MFSFSLFVFFSLSELCECKSFTLALYVCPFVEDSKSYLLGLELNGGIDSSGVSREKRSIRDTSLAPSFWTHFYPSRYDDGTSHIHLQKLDCSLSTGLRYMGQLGRAI